MTNERQSGEILATLAEHHKHLIHLEEGLKRNLELGSHSHKHLVSIDDKTDELIDAILNLEPRPSDAARFVVKIGASRNKQRQMK